MQTQKFHDFDINFCVKNNADDLLDRKCYAINFRNFPEYLFSAKGTIIALKGDDD